MAIREFSVRADGAVIGSVALQDWDRGMGVAGGAFLPNENYVLSRHAASINDREITPAPDIKLSLVDATGVELSIDSICLVDWTLYAGIDEREITVYGIDIVGVFGADPSDNSWSD